MDKAADSQILTGSPSFSFPESGQKLLNLGYMYAMPAIAAYDNWNPTSFMAPGEIVRWMMRADMSVAPKLLGLLDILALSLSIMKRNARTMDAPAPVAKVYRPQSSTVLTDLMDCACGEFPIMDRILEQM